MILAEARKLVAGFYASERLIAWEEAERDCLAGKYDDRDEMRVAMFILSGGAKDPNRATRDRIAAILSRAEIEAFQQELAAS